jgi:phosphoribosylanthranilate isomerase
MACRIKFCGLNTPQSVQAAARHQPDFLGFVHHPGSPRHLPLAQMGQLMRHAPETVHKVAVMIDPDDNTLHALMAHASPSHLQLHHTTDIARLHQIAAQTGLPLILAINVRSRADIATARMLEPHVAHILFDAAQAGSGSVFDWGMLHGHGLQKPWFLAGGLTAENVAEAIAQTQAPMVDVSSGIESKPGEKSVEKIARFTQAVIHPAHA